MLRGIKINSATAREFLFFLFLTTIVAGLIKLSKTYTTQYEITVALQDLPLDKRVKSIEPTSIKVRTESSGFSLLANSLESPNLKVSIGEMKRSSQGKYVYDVNEHAQEIKESLGGTQQIMGTSPEQVQVTIDSLSSKKVIIKPNIAITYGSGYGERGDPVITPDSVTLVGPIALLAQIDTIATQPIAMTEVQEDVSKKVSLDVSNLSEQLKLSINEVLFKQQVSKFTEGKSVIPITILGDPSGNVKILPKTAEIIYTVRLEDYEKIASSDFLVTCNYEKSDQTSNYLSLKIARRPEGVKAARLVNKQVKFIVVN